MKAPRQGEFVSAKTHAKLTTGGAYECLMFDKAYYLAYLLHKSI